MWKEVPNGTSWKGELKGMPEFRQNIATKEWVIIATERAKRPEDFLKGKETRPELPVYSETCPFCPGHEEKTPPSLLTMEDDGAWKLRVVPNKFAALQPQYSTKRERVGRFLKADGFGVAEVIIETPVHNKTIATMDVHEVQRTIEAYKSRQIAISEDPRINLVTVFRNHGSKAGTSLEHPHSQIIATPIVPPHVRYPITQATLAFDTHGSCVFCDMIQEEIQQKERIILETEHFVAFCPFASRSPFEARILPKQHSSSFTTISDAEIQDLAYVLRALLRKIYIALDNPDYNYVIRSAPTTDEDVRFYHWYIVIILKLTTPAGFEIGSGIYINTTYPEQCAAFLREVTI